MNTKRARRPFDLPRKRFSGIRFWLGILLLLGLLSFCPSLVGEVHAQKLPDGDELIARIFDRAKAVASDKNSPEYTYESKTQIEQLKGNGKVVDSEEKTYQVNLIAGYPLRHLTRLNGRELSGKELAHEQAKEEELRRKFTTERMEDLAARRETWLTTNLLARYKFKVVDRITLSNRSTLLLTFLPRQGELPDKSIQDRVLNLMAGTVWVDEQDADAAKLSVELVDTLSIGWLGLLGSLSKCEFTLERTRLPDGVWANARQTFEIQLRKLASTKRFRVTEVSGGYQRVPLRPTPSGESAPAN